ncbi:MAG: hypothetical protein J6J74_08100 [Elusimicrobiaceae bacterium]|nr:hypothetical protein [Elusimicrobiaceae bacterium]
MAKQTILKERDTGEVMYPHTHASLVQTSDGGNAEDAIDAAKYKLFDDQWTAAGGTVIVSGRVYGLNGVNDLTYQEALAILNYAVRSSNEVYRKLYGAKLRTNIFLFQSFYYYTLDISAFAQTSDLDVVRLAPDNNGECYADGTDSVFTNCRKLKTVLTTIVDYNRGSVPYRWRQAFKGCVLLEDVRIKGLKDSISFADSPLLSLASLQYLVTNAANTSAITVTVHADVYAKLTGDTTNAAASALTADELAQWQALVTTAADKNISFATT